jgi:hypothetical protein
MARTPRPEPLKPFRERFKSVRTVPRWILPSHGDMLVGYRFNVLIDEDSSTYENPSTRNGSRATLVVEGMPVSGPVFFQESPDTPWARYHAVCAGCSMTSNFYKIRHAGIGRWAHAHRCKARYELDRVIGPR